MDVFTARPDGPYPTLARQLSYRANHLGIWAPALGVAARTSGGSEKGVIASRRELRRAKRFGMSPRGRVGEWPQRGGSTYRNGEPAAPDALVRQPSPLPLSI